MLKPPAEDTALLLLIRHGATAANLRRPYILQGRSLNGPLSETGREQVLRAADFLRSFPIRHVHASPMLRAQETAALIAAPHGLTVNTYDELVEVDVGEWESLSWVDIEQRDPEHYARFHADPADTPYKGGESYRDVRNRVVPAFRALASQHLGEMVVVVAHNVVNRALLADTLQLDLRYAKDIKQNNACVNILRYHDQKLDLLTMNGIFHLGEA